jgi:hypothetical protein
MTPDPDVNLRWLALGAMAGLLAVALGLLRQSNPADSLPDSAVARVNETLIARDTYERALQRLQSDSSDALDERDEAWVLQRLIEEELLVQRGLSLGMAQQELDVRGAIVQSLVASVTAEADAASPDDTVLKSWFEQHPERYSSMSALTVDVWTTSDEESAREFLQAVNDGNPEAGSARRVPTVPAGPVPLDKLRDYLGPGITASAAGMPAGSSAVFARQGRWLIIRIVARHESSIIEFDRIRTQVLLDYRRSLADDRLRDYLDSLMQQADVVIARP